MFTVLMSFGESCGFCQFDSLEEACKYAYNNRENFCNINIDGRCIYNNMRVEDRKVIFENIWAKELLE